MTIPREQIIAWAKEAGLIQEWMVLRDEDVARLARLASIIEQHARRGSAIDEQYASRLAFMLECMLVDSHGHWNEAAALLDEYKAEWEKVNPSPPTFMGEPIPPERKQRLANALANRAKTSGSPAECPQCHGIGYYDEGHENDDGSMSAGNYVDCEKCKP